MRTAGAPAFATAVRGRHAATRRAGWTPSEIVLLSLAPRHTLVDGGLRVLFAPRLHFTVLAAATPRAAQPAAQAAGAGAVAPAVAPPIAPTLPVVLAARGPQVAAPRAAAIGLALAARGRRVEEAGPASDRATPARAAASGEPTRPDRPARSGAPLAPSIQPPRVVRRALARQAAPAQVPASDAAAASERRASERTWGGRPGSGGAAPTPPAVDLDRLTDSVVRALDRRLVAQRERQGRR